MAKRKQNNLWKCSAISCQPFDHGRFEAAPGNQNPQCPRCKVFLDDPKRGSRIQRLCRIHYDAPSEEPGVGVGYRACDQEQCITVQGGMNAIVMAGIGGMPNPYNGGTGNPLAVTCPECKATDAYKMALELTQDEDEMAAATAAACKRIENQQVASVR